MTITRESGALRIETREEGASLARLQFLPAEEVDVTRNKLNPANYGARFDSGGFITNFFGRWRDSAIFVKGKRYEVNNGWDHFLHGLWPDMRFEAEASWN